MPMDLMYKYEIQGHLKVSKFVQKRSIKQIHTSLITIKWYEINFNQIQSNTYISILLS